VAGAGGEREQLAIRRRAGGGDDGRPVGRAGRDRVSRNASTALLTAMF